MWSQGLGVPIAGAIGIDTISSILGLLVGHHASLPPGPTIIMIAGIIFVFSVLFGRQNGLIQRLRHPAHLNG
jgi:zinc/manganese transport system permease protein